jgi:hypothetical protein
MNASLSSGQPWKRTGSNSDAPVNCLLIKSVTGQVRWLVTGINPTRKGAPPAGLWAAKMPRFRVVCKNEMATNQSPTVRPTAFPEDIEVGKDGAEVELVSSESPTGVKGCRSPHCFCERANGDGSLTRFSLVAW